MMMRRTSRLLERLLFVVGFGALAYAGISYGYGWAYQKYVDATFSSELRLHLKPSAPLPLAEGMPVGRLEISRLDLSVMVLEGVEDSTLTIGAGHVPGTALPGAAGNVGIAAHRDTHFRSLRKIRNGDLIRVTTTEGAFDYAVEWTRVVKPTAVDVLDATSRSTLTLVTCYPFYFIGSAPDRFIVRASRIN